MDQVPDFLAIGHVTRDLHVDGSSSLGGAVTFAALCASRLGLKAAVVTSTDIQASVQLPTILPDVALHVRPAAQTTTYANRYSDGVRVRYCSAQGEALSIKDIPKQWISTPIVLFGVQAQEIGADIVLHYPRRSGTLLAAIPQGWLGYPDATGLVQPGLWHEIEKVFPALDVLVMSQEDLLPFVRNNQGDSKEILAQWSRLVPILVVTDGRNGAMLFHHGSKQHFPAYPVQEIDPTGAGDVFTSAFLIHLYLNGNPELAVDFANCAASFVVEQFGIQGVPTLAMVERRIRSRSR